MSAIDPGDRPAGGAGTGPAGGSGTGPGRFWLDFLTTLPFIVGPSCALWLVVLVYQGRELVYIP